MLQTGATMPAITCSQTIRGDGDLHDKIFREKHLVLYFYPKDDYARAVRTKRPSFAICSEEFESKARDDRRREPGLGRLARQIQNEV